MNNFHLRLQAHSGAVLYFWLSIVSVVVFILLYIMMIRPEWQKMDGSERECLGTTK